MGLVFVGALSSFVAHLHVCNLWEKDVGILCGSYADIVSVSFICMWVHNIRYLLLSRLTNRICEVWVPGHIFLYLLLQKQKKYFLCEILSSQFSWIVSYKEIRILLFIFLTFRNGFLKEFIVVIKFLHLFSL